jgi:DNA polymerase-3 subunit delta
MPQTAEAVLKDLEAKKFSPIYFLHGEEPFFIDEITNYIEENALPAAEKGFNQTILYGKEVSMMNVLENARRFPMMAQFQVVIVKEAQEMSDLGKKDAQEKLINYCKRPVPSTILVFSHKHKKIDGRTELSKILDKHAIVVESKAMYDNKIPDWIKEHCKKSGYPISEKAVRLLAEYIGNDLSRIAKEIDKIKINYQKNVEITDEMVMKHVGISKAYNIFELQTALANRDVLKANQIIAHFEANPKANPLIANISVLYGYFSKVLLFHHNKEKDNAELARILKVSPYFIKDYQQAAGSYPAHKVLQIISYLHQADLYSKGIDSAMEEGEIMKELIYKILH